MRSLNRQAPEALPASRLFPASSPPLRPALPVYTQAPNAAGQLGFLVLIPFLYFLFSRVLDITLPGLHLPMVFGLMASVAAFMEGSLLAVLQHKTTRFLALFTFWFCLTAMTGLWRGGSFTLFKDYWIKSILIFFCFACLAASLQRVRMALQTMAVAVSTAAVVGLLAGKTDREGRLAMSGGELSNSNFFGMFMILGLTLCWFGMADPKASRGRRAFWLLLTGPMLFAALKTGSRTAVVCFVLTGIYFFLRLPARKKFLVAFFIPPVLATTILFLPAELRTRLATLTVLDQEELHDNASELERAAVASTEGRWYLLQRSITITLQNPILGVGPHNFMVAESEMSAEEGLARGMWRVTHNGYTEVSSEMGLPGLFFYLAAIGSAWFSLRRWARFAAPRPECAEFLHIVVCLQLALFSLLVDIFFGLSLYSYFVPALLGLMVALDRWASTATRTSPPEMAGIPAGRF